MAEEEIFGNKVTVTGQNVYAGAQEDSTTVNLSEIALGDSNGAYYTPTGEENSLVNEVHRIPVKYVYEDTLNDGGVIVEGEIPNDIGGFTVRETAVYDDAGNMITIGKYPATPIPTPSQGAVSSTIIKLVFKISNSTDTSIFCPTTETDIIFASMPNHYERNGTWRIKNRQTAKNQLYSPDYLTVNIDNSGYALQANQTVNINDSSSWDDLSVTDWTNPDNRAGKDFYIYACKPSSGSVPSFVISNDSTYPEGYTEDNSRKIGGFHCLCADIGTNVYSYDNARTDVSVLDNHFVSHDITTSSVKHWLEGYTAGDIIPFSIWDLNHRPVCNPEGMTYDPKADIWVQIYLPSWNGNLIESVYDGNVADGDNGWHQYRFDQQARQQKAHLPEQGEFVSFSLGSPQGVNISDSADPGTTGGHTATDGNRIVSLIGVEDATGVFWQWGREGGATNEVGSTNEDAFDTNDLNVEGEHYEAPNRPRFGGNWGRGSSCGSRGSYWSNPALYLSAHYSSRFLSGSRSRS